MPLLYFIQLVPILSFGSQNLVTPIFDKTTFGNAGIPTILHTFCQNLVQLGQLGPLKNHKKYVKILFIVSYHYDPKFSDRLIWANSADPDQTAPSDQGLHCLLFKRHLFNKIP